jgi:hypothetical protein
MSPRCTALGSITFGSEGMATSACYILVRAVIARIFAPENES